MTTPKATEQMPEEIYAFGGDSDRRGWFDAGVVKPNVNPYARYIRADLVPQSQAAEVEPLDNVRDFSSFIFSKEKGEYQWQRADYIEDGEYIGTTDFKEFTVYSIPNYGGEVEVYAKTYSFQEAVRKARSIT